MTRAAQLLTSAAQEGVDILSKLTNVCKTRYQCPPLNPSFICESKAVLLLRTTKAGLGLGFRGGHGVLLARLPSASPSAPPVWSAPVFLKVTVAQLGLIMGVEQVDSFLLAMSNRVLDELLAGSHTMRGVDQSAVVGNEVQDKSDVIAASGSTAELVGVSHASGVMLDFSLSGGSLSIDEHKMTQVYGEAGHQAAQVMKGMVAAPAELAPLYDKLHELTAGGTTAPIGLTRTSLERMTAGYDPDRRALADASAVAERAPPRHAAPPAGPLPGAGGLAGTGPSGGVRHVIAVPLTPGVAPSTAAPGIAHGSVTRS